VNFSSLGATITSALGSTATVGVRTMLSSPAHTPAPMPLQPTPVVAESSTTEAEATPTSNPTLESVNARLEQLRREKEKLQTKLLTTGIRKNKK